MIMVDVVIAGQGRELDNLDGVLKATKEGAKNGEKLKASPRAEAKKKR